MKFTQNKFSIYDKLTLCMTLALRFWYLSDWESSNWTSNVSFGILIETTIDGFSGTKNK